MKKTLLSVGIGAAVMYLLDPELGDVRRSMLIDRLRGVAPKTTDAVAAKAGALGATVHDVTAKADEKAAGAIESIPVETAAVQEAVQEAAEEASDAKELEPAA